ncbi:MAG: Holliday junction branch migration protein RuvA [Bdellovibrionota bacterium]
MIARLRGSLAEKSEERVIVDVQGVGYGLFIPSTVFHKLPDLNAEVTLQVHTHVREDHIILYGFLSQIEKDVFEILMSASGVGAKTALAILSAAEAEQILLALSQGNTALLTGISGVGKKTVEKLFIELKEKADKRLLLERGVTPAKRTAASNATIGKTSWIADLEQALLALGYRDNDVSAIVRDVAGKTAELGGFDAALRYALSNLSRGSNKSARGNA